MSVFTNYFALVLAVFWLPAQSQVANTGRFCFPPPDVAFATRSPGPNLAGNRYSSGTVLTFVCASGYVNVGSDTAVCTNRAWRVSRARGIPRCEVVTVAPPVDACSGATCPENSDCVVIDNSPRCVCRAGFVQVGQSCQLQPPSPTPIVCVGGCPDANSNCIRIQDTNICACNVGFLNIDGVCIRRARFSTTPGQCRGSCPANSQCGTVDTRFVCGCDVGFIVFPQRRLCVPRPNCPRPIGPFLAVTGAPLSQTVWQVGETITFSCTSGYQLQGAAVGTCLSNGAFSISTPTCILPAPTVTCSRPPPSPFRFILSESVANQQVWQVGEIINYGCENNFIIEGSRRARCLPTGQFMNPPPVCIPAPSPRPTGTIAPPGDCIIPIAPTNGQFSPFRRQWLVGNTVTYSCNSGFRLVGVAVQTCLEGGSYTSSPPLCEALVTCSIPVRDNATIVTPDIRTEVSPDITIVYSCVSGFVLIGESRLTCLSNGSYSAVFPFCLSTAPATPAPTTFCVRPQNLDPFIATIPDNDQQVWREGDSIVYVCTAGTQLSGNPSATCLSNGQFDALPPTCALPTPTVTCSRPPPSPFRLILSESVANQQVWQVGEIINYGCENNFIIEGSRRARCLPTGQFMNPPPVCIPAASPRPTGTIAPPGDCIIPIAPTNAPATPAPTTFCVRPQNLDPFIATIPDNDQQVWREGDSIIYICTAGTQLSGNPSATCLSNGQFDALPPTCALPTTSATTAPTTFCVRPTNLDTLLETVPNNQLVWREGETITYICTGGSQLNGIAQATCLSNTQFSSLPPTCAITAAATCPRPLTDVFLIALPENQITWAVGEPITFQCRPGFRLEGNAVSTCLLNGEFNSTTPVCLRIPATMCTNPPVPNNGFILTPPGSPVRTSWTVGETVFFGCNSPDALVGAANSTCLASGAFEDTVSFCIGTGLPPTPERTTCVRPPQPEGGFISNIPADSNSVSVDQNVVFGCDTGFILRGIPVLTCQSDLTYNFAPPTCEIPQCQRPAAPENGEILSTGIVFNVDDILIYNCLPGFNLVGNEAVVCMETEMFEEAPICVPVVVVPNTCASPSPPQNGAIRNFQSNYNEGQAIVYSCDPGFDLDGEATAICQNDRSFSSPPPVCVPTGFATVCDIFPPLNGSIVGGVSSINPGQTITYTCDEGLRVPRRLGSVATCEANGTLDFTPTCTVCDPDVPVNGAIVMTIASAIPERYVIGSLIEFQCNDGFTRTGGFEVGLCQANNDIQGGRPICVPSETAGQVPTCIIRNPENGLVVSRNITAGQTATITEGGIIRYMCNEGFSIDGSDFAVCSGGEHTPAPPTCLPS